MAKIELNTGILLFDNYCFPAILNEQSIEVYQNLSRQTILNNRKCNITAYYKNRKLRHIHIHLDEKTLNDEFNRIESELKEGAKDKPKFTEIIIRFLISTLQLRFLKRFLSEPAPEKNYIREYVDYYKKETEKVVDYLSQTKKRNFEWGKIKTLVDPRGPYIFNEIKYFKTLHNII